MKQTASFWKTARWGRKGLSSTVCDNMCDKRIWKSMDIVTGITEYYINCANGIWDPLPPSPWEIAVSDKAAPCRFCFQVSFLTNVNFLTNEGERNSFNWRRRVYGLYLPLACLLSWGLQERATFGQERKDLVVLKKKLQTVFWLVCKCCRRKWLEIRHTFLINRDLKSYFYLIWAWHLSSVTLNSFGNTKIFNSHVAFKVLWGMRTSFERIKGKGYFFKG